MKKVLIALLISVLASSTSYGATSKPSAKPSAKSTTKATSKSTTKATSKTKSKVTIAKKPVVKRKVYVRKKVKPSPSPKPVWPPKGFTLDPKTNIYYKIPTGSDLVGLISASASLTKNISQCEISACGAVYIASPVACTWWEILATVRGPSYADISTLTDYGNLRVTYKGTAARAIAPIFLYSSEPLFPNEEIILRTLNISRNNFYSALSAGKSLSQIAYPNGSKLVKAIMAAEKSDIDSRMASGSITASQANDQKDELPNRVANELNQYRLTFEKISAKCWFSSPTENVPSTTYEPLANR